MPVRPTHEMHAYEVHARISCVYLIGVYFIAVDLIDMHLMGVHLLWIISLNGFVCEVTPHANSPSPELALEIAPPIHPDFCISQRIIRFIAASNPWKRPT
jgi:hypothetical protein